MQGQNSPMKPVMDVKVPPRLPQASPRDAAASEAVGELAVKPPLRPAAKAVRAAVATPSAIPVGLITVTIFTMLLLAGLATLVYMTQSA